MKNRHLTFLAALGLGFFASQLAQAQTIPGLTVGYPGAAAPRTALDINGAISVNEISISASGANFAQTIGPNVGQVQLTATPFNQPTGTIALTSTLAVDGQYLLIYNNCSLDATFNMLALPAKQAVGFMYSTGAWHIVGSSLITANSGLTTAAGIVRLGGPLLAPTTITGLTSTNSLEFAGTAAATFANTTAAATTNVSSRALGLQGLYNATGALGGVHLSFLDGNAAEVGRVASLQESGPAKTGLGFSTAGGTAGTVTERMRLSAGGFLGLGSTAPIGKLHLLTTGGSGGADDDQYVDTYTGGSGAASSVYYRHSRGTLASPSRLSGGDNLLDINGQYYNNGSFVNSVFLTASYTGSGSSNKSYLALGTSGSERLRISDAGTVGIGTTAPVGALHVVGSNAQTLHLQGTTHSAGAVISTLILDTNGTSSNSSKTNTQITGQDDGNNGGKLNLVTSNTNRLTILNDGRIGLGTISPNETLEVNGNIRLGVNPVTVATGAGNYIEFLGQNLNTDPLGIYRYNIDANSSANTTELRVVVGDDPTQYMTDRFSIGTIPKNSNVSSINQASFTPAFTIFSNGEVLSSNGATLTSAGVWTNASDRRLKKDIAPLSYGLQAVLKLRPVAYKMRRDGTPQVGFIAQEVRDLIPEVVSGKEGDLSKGENLSMSYGNLVAVLTKAMQEQQQQLDALRAANAKLTAANATLKASLAGKAAASTLGELQTALRTLRAEVQALKASGTTASLR